MLGKSLLQYLDHFPDHEFLQCVHPPRLFQSGHHLDLHPCSQFQKRHVGQKQMMPVMILMMLMCDDTDDVDVYLCFAVMHDSPQSTPKSQSSINVGFSNRFGECFKSRLSNKN
jgi:hypothetical protein